MTVLKTSALAIGFCLATLLAQAPVVAQPAPAQAVAVPQTGVIPLQGQANFRDLGGYLTRDGRQVKWGMVYRSGDLSALTPVDEQTLAALHIRAVCDLRNGVERDKRPDRWAAGPVQTYASDKPDMDPAAHALLAAVHQTPDQARAAMTAYYAQMPEIFAPEFRAVFQRLVQGQTPLLLHCTAGKDRTGVASALILLALGVPRETVVQDYVLTNRLLRTDRLPAIPNASPETLAVLYRADPAYIEAAIDATQSRYRSVDAYLQQQLGVGPGDLLVLRASLLQRPGASSPSAP